MDWPVMAVRAGSFAPVGSTAHNVRRRMMENREHIINGAVANANVGVKCIINLVALTLPASSVVPVLLARDPRPPGRLASVAVVRRVAKELRVPRELILTVEREGVNATVERVGIRSDLGVRNVDVPAIGGGERRASIAVLVIGEF